MLSKIVVAALAAAIPMAIAEMHTVTFLNKYVLFSVYHA